MPWPTMPQIIAFKDAGFPFDDPAVVVSLPPGWGWSYVGDDWNDSISSVIVLSGTWQFFEHGGFAGASATVGPGWYTFVENSPFNMQNDSISSIQCLDWNDNAPVTG
jgi:Beta/Gamma crystallin